MNPPLSYWLDDKLFRFGTFSTLPPDAGIPRSTYGARKSPGKPIARSFLHRQAMQSIPMRAHEGKTVRRRNARRGEGMTNNVKGTPIVKGLGFNSFGIGTNACTVDIDEEQDKILRIRPLHFDGALHPRGDERLEDRGARKDVRARLQDADLAAVARLQEARVLQEPHPLPDAPRGLGPARRAPSGDARHQRLCAHHVGRGVRPHRGKRSSACTTRTARPPSCASSTAMARRSSSMRRTAARAACSTSSAPTRCRRANPTAGKAGTGAPSTSGAWTRSGRTRCRTTSSRTSPRTATRCCSGAATWRRPPWDGAATWQAGCASGSPSWASSRSTSRPT